MRLRPCSILTIALLTVAGGVTARAAYKEWRWKNFAVVDEGKIYRSGQLTERQLIRAVERLGLRTVICLHGPSARWESTVCQHQGVNFFSLPMPSDGSGEAEEFAECLAIARDPAHQPVLIHCQAGVARTGLAVALYRTIVERWPRERAFSELKLFERKGRMEDALARHFDRVYREIMDEGVAGHPGARREARRLARQPRY